MKNISVSSGFNRNEVIYVGEESDVRIYSWKEVINGYVPDHAKKIENYGILTVKSPLGTLKTSSASLTT